MRKKNGFIATTLIYSFLLLFATLIVVIIGNYSYYRNTLHTYNKGINKALNSLIDSKYVTLHNEIDNSDFEVKYSSWQAGTTTNFSGNGNIGYDCNQGDCTNKNGYYQTDSTNAGGNNSFRFAPRINATVNSNTFNCVANNYYYVSYDVFASGTLSGGNIGIFNNSSGWEVYEPLNYGFQNWNRRGIIGKVSSGGSCTFRIDYQNGGGGADVRMNIDNVMVINITELLSKAGINISNNELKTKCNSAFTDISSDAKISHFKDSSVYDVDSLKNVVNNVFTFAYSNSQTYFRAPSGGIYLLEVWGAQGGGTPGNAGGYGAYSSGEISLNKDEIVYVTVGGVGQGTSSHIYLSGGYNGGGSANPTNDYNEITASGGGASHIATTNRGTLDQYASYQNELLIVAGGGGGSAGNKEIMYVPGGSGGGFTGNAGGRYIENLNHVYIDAIGYGATQVAGGKYYSQSNSGSGGVGTGSFGKGANGNYVGAGGGYYGGGLSHSSAGGGSGYIGNSLLTNKFMYCYKCAESSEVNTKTVSTSCAREMPTSNCAKKGDGFARITLIRGK